MMRLDTQIRIIGALAKADEKKETLKSCQTCPLREECMANYRGALCQKALSESIGIKSPQSLSRTLRDNGGLVEIFVLHDKPKNYPRKFIKLPEGVNLSRWFVGG